MKTKEDVVEEFRKQSICDAAMRVVGRKGLHNVTVQDIAAEAGVAKGTIYLYFDSREAIIAYAKELAMEELRGKLAAACDSCHTFREKLERRVRTQLEHFDENRDFFRMYLAISEPSGEKRLRKEPSYCAFIEQLESILREAMKSGEVRRFPLNRLAEAMTSVVRDITLNRIIEKDPPPIDDDVAFAVDFLLRGIGQPS
ncbi:MAG TPA: TetR/AcrR family transcriptional regulator [Thermoanaerobaculia bacterium]|nr:TetR/AcrR family transcriptional regulator [Thermoanaerobaculia bacterium]